MSATKALINHMAKEKPLTTTMVHELERWTLEDFQKDPLVSMGLYRNVAAELAQVREAEGENIPLTYAEVAAMHGKPVYTTVKYEKNLPGVRTWMLVYAWDEETVWLVDMFGDKWELHDDRIAEIYRRPPEAGAGMGASA